MEKILRMFYSSSMLKPCLYLKQWIHIITTQRSHQQLSISILSISISLLNISILPIVIHYLHNAHLIFYKNIYDYYRSKDCMKNFDQDLKEHVIKITNSNKKCYH